jgi:hypothetical protein
MDSAPRLQQPAQQNHHTLHPSLSARFSRRSRENPGRKELASRNAFRVADLAHTSAARTVLISRRLGGTGYCAELQEPLDFGVEPLTRDMAAVLGAAPPPGSFVRTLLTTPLNAANTAKGAPLEAILSQPLFDGKRLILPQGCRFRGSVVQVQPARYLSRNGQRRMVFHELPPEGAGGAQKVEANWEGVQAAAADNVALDAEGGAQASSPKSSYMLTTISIGIGTRPAPAPAATGGGAIQQ